MTYEPMKLIIQNYRAIANAEISLNGLTIVSGINGCGKSTISKMLFNIITISNDFYPIARLNNLEILKEFYKLFEFIVSNVYISNFFNENINKEIESSEHDDIKKDLKFILIDNKFSKEDEEKVKSNISNVINRTLSYILKSLKIKNTSLLHGIYETVKYRAEELEISPKEFQSESDYFKYLFEQSESKIQRIISKVFEESFITKPKEYFLNRLPIFFHTDESPSKLELHENRRKLISMENPNILEPFYIKNVIYLNTPMAFKSINTNHEYWKELNSLLYKEPDQDTLLPEGNKLICNKIIEIIGGDINISTKDSSSNKITFSKKNDGLKLDLIDCATGIQSLSIIYALLNNNSINDKTLLILDEPEVHLHPQWIIELASVLVLMRKHIKCHIFVSTHSTDMIRGLKYLSEKEKIQENVNFFIAKESQEENHKYDYIDLKNNIGEIFKCFNKSLDRIDALMEEDNS